MTTEHLIEYAIEFAWQMKDKETMPRAERRHEVVKAIQDFLNNNPSIPDEDIDEFIAQYIGGKGLLIHV